MNADATGIIQTAGPTGEPRQRRGSARGGGACGLQNQKRAALAERDTVARDIKRTANLPRVFVKT